MIRSVDISVVVQGDFRPNTMQVLECVRATAPNAQVIFSSVSGGITAQQRSDANHLVSEWVITPDPGALPPTVVSPTAPLNNLNRMLVSTQGGLCSADRTYTLKVRSDAEIDVAKTTEIWDAGRMRCSAEPLLFASRYTRHPDGINGYLFHLSDWITFGRTEQVMSYWSAPQMSHADATWFLKEPHAIGTTATAKRFRARMSQEQWLATRYAGKRGYRVPTQLTGRSEGLVDSYRAFLAKECVIADHDQIGLKVPGHLWADASLFQRLDCLSHEDWTQIRDGYLLGTPERIEPIRAAARAARHAIAAGVLLRKWITKPIASIKDNPHKERSAT